MVLRKSKAMAESSHLLCGNSISCRELQRKIGHVSGAGMQHRVILDGYSGHICQWPPEWLASLLYYASLYVVKYARDHEQAWTRLWGWCVKYN
ncbi:hypothetical protein VPH35_135786 [Triticum aestivum]